MARIEARDLAVRHIGQLVTLTDDTGESLTMTLQQIARDADGVTVTGRCLGRPRTVEDMPAWDVLHVYEETPAEPDDWELIDTETAARLRAHIDRIPPMPALVVPRLDGGVDVAGGAR